DLAFSPDGSRLYVGNQSSDSVAVVDTATDTVVNTILIEDEPLWVAVSPDGTRAYVANVSSVSVIDTATNVVIDTLPAPSARGVTVSPDGAYIYVTEISNLIRQFDAATHTLVATVPFSGDGNSRPHGLAFSPDGTTLYGVDSNPFIDQIRAFLVDGGTGALSVLDVVAAADTSLMAAPCGNGNAVLAGGRNIVPNAAGALGCTARDTTFTGGTLRINAVDPAFFRP